MNTLDRYHESIPLAENRVTKLRTCYLVEKSYLRKRTGITSTVEICCLLLMANCLRVYHRATIDNQAENCDKVMILLVYWIIHPVACHIERISSSFSETKYYQISINELFCSISFFGQSFSVLTSRTLFRPSCSVVETTPNKKTFDDSRFFFTICHGTEYQYLEKEQWSFFS